MSAGLSEGSFQFVENKFISLTKDVQGSNETEGSLFSFSDNENQNMFVVGRFRKENPVISLPELALEICLYLH